LLLVSSALGCIRLNKVWEVGFGEFGFGGISFEVFIFLFPRPFERGVFVASVALGFSPFGFTVEPVGFGLESTGLSSLPLVSSTSFSIVQGKYRSINF
jgi:hypothetical protein